MKKWFKYANGYVNINDENIYLTTTGNWSETINLKEKGLQQPNSIRKFRIIFFIAIVGLFSSVLFFYKLSLFKSTRNILILLGLPGITFFSVYNYLKRETGYKFKLPISKILTINLDKRAAIITFKDYENKEDEIVLYSVSDKGVSILVNLQNKKIS